MLKVIFQLTIWLVRLSSFKLLVESIVLTKISLCYIVLSKYLVRVLIELFLGCFLFQCFTVYVHKVCY